MNQSVSALGSASRVFLHHSLVSLNTDINAQKSALILRQGKALEILQQLVKEIGATHIYWNRCYEPEVRQRDEEIKSSLKSLVMVESFNGSMLFEPWEILKGDGTPYRVFTPYWKMLTKEFIGTHPLSIPLNLKPPQNFLDSLLIEDLNLLPRAPIPRWDEAMISHWEMSEDAAHQQFQRFLEDDVADYKEHRDFPAIDGTTLLSPYLHFGQISPLQLFHIGRTFQTNSQKSSTENGVDQILRQVVWREFAYYLLYHFPQTVSEPLYEKYAAFEWLDNPEQLKQWQQGMTGFPIIDAGMRQLYATGYMHNRIRMIASSFLCKNLLVHWRLGEAWFRDTLVDADLANNTMGWQWVAGCGADAAPYFRVFNPVLQSTKFDKKGEYIRRWVPELRSLNDKEIHQPTAEMAKQNNYPEMIVDLKATRQRALDRYSEIKNKAANSS
ncbi:UNVERIFIED_CONTAM: hypothetical protein GTU68_017053 [Idotea baltica]|nr:hypothetical protein [Idotea baltica]